MKLAFWKKDKRPSLDVLCWNMMVAATDPDECWKIATLFRETKCPAVMVNCETSFLMGSVARGIIRARVRGSEQPAAVRSAESAYLKTFDDQSEEELPPGAVEIYGNVTLSHIARIALATYGEQNDLLPLTSALLVSRIKGDPRMMFEITPLIEARAREIESAFVALLS